MSNIRTSDIKSNVVDTVRNLKKKRTLDSEERSNTTSSKTNSLTSVDKTSQAASSSVNKEKNSSKASTTKSIPYGSTQPSRDNISVSVKRSTNYIQDENVPSRSDVAGSMGSDDARSNVFNRLASKSTTLAPNKRLKKIAPQIMNFFEPKFNQATFNLIEALAQKSNTLVEVISGSQFNEETVVIKMSGDQHFMLCFKNLLMELQKSGEIVKELKYISKSTLNKLEKFLVEKVEDMLKYEKLDNVFNEHIKRAQQLSNDRISHLKNQLLQVSEEY